MSVDGKRKKRNLWELYVPEIFSCFVLPCVDLIDGAERLEVAFSIELKTVSSLLSRNKECKGFCQISY